MNTKQTKQLMVAFGVVVFLGMGNSCAIIQNHVNPGRLKALVSHVTKAVKPVKPTTDWDIAMLPEDLNHFDEQLDAIGESLEKHGAELAAVKAMIADFQERDPSHPYLLQLEEVKKALKMLKDRLVAIEKSQRGNVNIDHRVSVNVGGSASLEAVSTAGYVFGKICDVVKSFGPSLMNCYVAYKVFELMREHREAMAKMITDMQRILVEQAARVDKPVSLPQSSQDKAFDIESGNSWMHALQAMVMIVTIFKGVQGVFTPLPKPDEGLGIVPAITPVLNTIPLSAQPEPKAWRIIGGEKIPVW